MSILLMLTFSLAFLPHVGVPNTQLVKEDSHVSSIYRNQSVAEQNSVDLAWALLMEDNFKELRNVIYATEEERMRFRQLVVNGKF
jgi:3'5'-cyclic nucleotide phosphodiesterase